MLPWQYFCQGALGQKFQFFVKNGLFSFKTYLYRIFWLEFEISASELTSVPNFSLIGQKIRELEFWPRTIPKMAWWRHTYRLMMTSAKNFYGFWEILSKSTSMPSLVVIGPQIKEKERGHKPPACMVPKDPSLNRVMYQSLPSVTI